MIIDIVKLKSGVVDYIDINEKLVVDDKLIKEASIISLNDTFVTGRITKNMNDYNLNLTLTGEMILPCSISLKPVSHKFEVEITGNFYDLLSEILENSKKTQNTIDIFPIIWENILMEIPMRIVSPNLDDVITEGDGWQLIDEEVHSNVNPELQKLKDLFK